MSSKRSVMRNGVEVLSDRDTCTVDEFEEAVAAFLQGDLTLAQLEGLTAHEMYAVADVGRELLSAGNTESARAIFEGLVSFNPHDPYFHLVLGSIEQQSGNFGVAATHYRKAGELYPEEISAWTNLGESLLLESCRQQQSGDTEAAGAVFDEAIAALARATEIDPEAGSGPGKRAHALLAVTVSFCSQEAAASGVC